MQVTIFLKRIFEVTINIFSPAEENQSEESDSTTSPHKEL